MSIMDHAEQVLQEKFGFESFRPGQRIIIESTLTGRDVLAVMPTGAGKSLCFQLPAMMLEGVTLVVSPLIALMKDQVDGLQEKGLPAGFINSTLSLSEQQERLQALELGALKILYVAPERFRSRAFVRALERVKISLFAIDEAHCISQWGHDFRPDYLKLARAIRDMNPERVQALTATANAQVQADILQQIPRSGLQKFIGGFDRPNLTFNCERLARKADKPDRVLELVQRLKSGIIYTATRKAAEEISAFLTSRGQRALCYHGGLEPDARKQIQDLFMSGQIPVVCATNAFGMGIDKPDIRFVIHYQMPGTVEAYYQEAGRAGRDGKPSECFLLYSAADVRVQKFFIEGENPPRPSIEALYAVLVQQARRHPEAIVERTQDELAELVPEFKSGMGVSTGLKLLESADHLVRLSRSSHAATLVLENHAIRLPPQAHVQKKVLTKLRELAGRNESAIEIPLEYLARMCDLEDTSLRRAIHELEAKGVLTYEPPFMGRGVRMMEPVPLERLGIDWATLERKAAHAYEKLELMRQYVFSRTCRRSYLLRYFGESKTQSNCGNCDVCQSQGSRATEHGGKAAGKRRKPPCSESGPLPQATAEEDQATVLKILSCVARLKGEHSQAVLVECLRGSRRRELLQLEIDRLSTYGLLLEWPAERVEAWVELLLETGALAETRQSTKHMASSSRVYLTEAGWKLIRERDTSIVFFPRLAKEHPTFSAVPAYDAELFGKLRRAQQQHLTRTHMGEHRALADTVLQGVCRFYPTTERELRGEIGLSPMPLKMWGTLLAEEVQKHLRSHGIDPGKVAVGIGAGSKTQGLDAVGHEIYEALRIWRQEIAEKRGIPTFYILHDSHLKAVCKKRPTNRKELLEVNGFGPKRLDRYGKEILDLILMHLSADAPR